MQADVLATLGESFHFTLATGPSDPGRTVTLEALYGLDGVDTGVDSANESLVFPVSMTEGTSGVYSTELALGATGKYWGRIHIDGVHTATVLVHVVVDDWPAADAIAETKYTVALVATSDPTSVQLTITDSSAAQAGLDSGGVAISWPEAMVQVPGYTDSWYYDSVTFSEGGRYQVAFAPDAGPIWNDVIVVHQDPQTGVLAHFNGWAPEAGLIPQDWVSISYIRKWTGWTTSHIGDEDIRELRRTAIETFIYETNVWGPSWRGTWYGMKGQGRRLYLPVPLLLPQDGGDDPVARYIEPWGDQAEIESIDNSDLAWYVRGRHAKQPFVERVRGRWWDRADLVVAITGTWGFVGPDRTLPIRLKQAVVGLIRWHALSLGTDADDARDQSTLNRIAREGTRDSSAMYHDSAIGMGITGDRTVDRVLAELTVQPGPWVHKRGLEDA